ncbi:hypothetical protein [Solidesulfovibrio alcoholivorans]|uniref:hypothetical protein n=1 Tax=Solidesulfovibrio alcoholivorans TaxID=81406 RepID=UPI0012EC6B56|nr:hypothetical protein [Solidesulfovibrio alcoholivorans]
MFYCLRFLVISVALLFCLLLTACSSGPSKLEAGAAIDVMNKSMAKELGAMFGADEVELDKIPHVKVSDMKCSKIGDDTYDCTVLAILDGETSQERLRFTKLDEKWRATRIK